MYCLYSLDEGNKPVLFIEGRLNSAEEIEKVIKEKLTLNNNTDDQSFIIDLSKTEFISEKCFRMFQNIRHLYRIEFRNYPLYIGMQLNDYNLLGGDIEDADKV